MRYLAEAVDEDADEAVLRCIDNTILFPRLFGSRLVHGKDDTPRIAGVSEIEFIRVL